jgi:hypothetical protein
MNHQYVNLFTVVHFVLYFMIGILFPNRFGIAVGVSLLWEIVEGYAARHPFVYPLLQKYWFIPEKYWNEGISNKITDIIANLTGYYIGSHSSFVSKYKAHSFWIAFIIWISTVMYSKYNAV